MCGKTARGKRTDGRRAPPNGRARFVIISGIGDVSEASQTKAPIESPIPDDAWAYYYRKGTLNSDNEALITPEDDSSTESDDVRGEVRRNSNPRNIDGEDDAASNRRNGDGANLPARKRRNGEGEIVFLSNQRGGDGECSESYRGSYDWDYGGSQVRFPLTVNMLGVLYLRFRQF